MNLGLWGSISPKTVLGAVRRGASGPSDTTAPTVTITSTESSPTFAATIPLTITFSEAVTGFAVGDITVVGCTLGALTDAGGGVFTVTATPTAMSVTVDIAAEVAQDAAGNKNTAATQFTMTALNVGLDLWLRADSISGNDGDAVSAWVSGEGNSLSFANTLTARPLLKKTTNGINNQPTVLFDGSDDILICTTANLWSDRSAGTLFAVVRYTAPIKSGQDVFASADQATAASYILNFEAADASAYMRLYQDGNGAANDNHATTTAQIAGTPYMLMWKSSGTALAMEVNGTNQTVNGTNNGDWFADTPNRDNATVGGVKYNALGGYFKGDVAEILLYNSELSAGNITTVEAYLADRYGPF